MSYLLYARGDNSSSNNASIKSQGTTTTPTTEIVFSNDPAAGTDGDVLLEYDNGNSDPDTLMTVDGVETTFTVEFSGLLPNTNKLSNINGFDLRGEEIVVITDDTTGQRYYLLTNSETLFSSDAEMFATLDAMPNGKFAISGVDTTNPVAICFARGTLIETPYGPVPIEKLGAGEILLTDQGPEEIVWIGSHKIGFFDLVRAPALRPILVAAHAFGKNHPHSDVMVSPNHRIAVAGWSIDYHLGFERALCAAKHLVDGKRVRRMLPDDGVEFFHILLNSHRTVWSHGLESETLYPGKQALASVSRESRAELENLFPLLSQNSGHNPLVLPELCKREAAFVD